MCLNRPLHGGPLPPLRGTFPRGEGLSAGRRAACLPLMREVPEGRRERKRPVFRFVPTELETSGYSLPQSLRDSSLVRGSQGSRRCLEILSPLKRSRQSVWPPHGPPCRGPIVSHRTIRGLVPTVGITVGITVAFFGFVCYIVKNPDTVKGGC